MELQFYEYIVVLFTTRENLNQTILNVSFINCRSIEIDTGWSGKIWIC